MQNGRGVSLRMAACWRGYDEEGYVQRGEEGAHLHFSFCLFNLV
jgi:hypothetical protein